MDRKMRVSDQNWERLKRWATPFEDSPDDALGKVLAIAETIHDASTLDQPRIPDQTLTNGYSIPQIAKGEKERRPTGNQDEIFNIDGVGETSRLPRGIRVPQQSFELPILESLHELEGRAKGTDVLAKVEPKVKCLLSEVDYQMVSNGTQIPGPIRPTSPASL